MDKYQERYVEHQEKKKMTLKEIIRKRHSDRAFGDTPMDEDDFNSVLISLDQVPSSCNRKAIKTTVIGGRNQKAFLGGVLVGGVGWIHRADKIILLYADEDAYKENLDYMKYLDTGVIIQNAYLMATELNLAICYVNPNIRDAVKEYFYDYFHVPDNYTFTGAIALGRKE